MKATIFEIKRFAVHDGDGIRTTVFFKGCPLRCLWCHNPEGLHVRKQLSFYAHKCVGCGACLEICPEGVHSFENGLHKVNMQKCSMCGKCEDTCLHQAVKVYGTEVTVDELLPVLLEDKDFYDNSNGGVTLSGGECLIQADFCAALLKELKKRGIHTAVDTCGYVPREDIEKVLPYTDVFLYDIKAIDEAVHIKCTGHSNRVILDNLKYIDQCEKAIEVRIPYVPGLNSEEIRGIAHFLKDMKMLTKVRILPYHNYSGSKYESLGMDNCLPLIIPSTEEIQEAENIMIEYGIRTS